MNLGPGRLIHGTITFPQDLRARTLTVSARAILRMSWQTLWRHPARLALAHQTGEELDPHGGRPKVSGCCSRRTSFTRSWSTLGAPGTEQRPVS